MSAQGKYAQDEDVVSELAEGFQGAAYIQTSVIPPDGPQEQLLALFWLRVGD